MKAGASDVIDVMGATIEMLAFPPTADAGYCVMKGTIPAGGMVPMHSHSDNESFFLLSGAVDVLMQEDGRLDWRQVKSGDFVHVPGGAKHAWRNTAEEPMVGLITTTPTLGRFFLEIGKPLKRGASIAPPTPERIESFARAAAKHGHWLGSPAENAAVGLTVPG